MKSALVAIEPMSDKNKNFEHFSEILRLFQDRGFFSQTFIVSIINAALYAVPLLWYREMEGQLAVESLARITNFCKGSFHFAKAEVLKSNSNSYEYQVLVLSTNERRGISYWYLGSFAKTAALTASLPVLIIKPQVHKSDFAREIRLVLAIDVATPLSAKALLWIIKMAKQSEAHIDLVYVEPKRRLIVGALQPRKNKEES